MSLNRKSDAPAYHIYKPYLQVKYSSGTSGAIHGFADNETVAVINVSPEDRIFKPEVYLNDFSDFVNLVIDFDRNGTNEKYFGR
jgi:hypothetical protein